MDLTDSSARAASAPRADGTSVRELGLAFQIWHRLLRLLLVVQVPLLALFGYFREVDLATAIGLAAVPAVLVVAASAIGSERFRACLVAVGLAWCSWLLVVWSGGAIEAHFYALIAIGLVALYRDWSAVAVVAVAQVVLHLVVGQLDPELVYNHEAALNAPAVWAFIHVIAIAGAVAIPIFTWRGSRAGERDSATRASSEVLEAAELRRQHELSAVYATVARRSQALLERQIDVIEQLEQDEKDPKALQQLFRLDHLATRMNREAASMLVLAGGEPNRKVTGSPPMSEVVRAAVGEIEDYTRVDLELGDDRSVEGRVVASLVHLMSELVENAAEYSPPGTRVRVEGTTTSDAGYQLRVVDRGIGLDDVRMAEYNHLLANPPATTPADNQRLGLDVVARLAGRHGLPVRLEHNADGRGITATVQVPPPLLGRADERVLSTAPEPDRVAAPVAAAAPSPAPQPDVAAAPGATREPAPAPAAAASPVVGQSIPRWASATQQSGGPGPSATPSEPAAARQAATANPGMSWSYSGHLKPREEPARHRPAEAGRGSRSQVSAPAPREPDPTEQRMADLLDAGSGGRAPTPSGWGTPPPGAWASQPAGGPGATGDLPGDAPVHPPTGPAGPSDVASQRASQAAEAARLLQGMGDPADAADPPAASGRPTPAPTPGPDPDPGAPSAPSPGPPAAPPPPAARPTRARPTSAGAAGGGPVAAGETRSGLPKRARGESLPRGLREPGPAPERSASAAPVSREESRSLLSSYQSRLQAGRKAAEDQVAQHGSAPDTAQTPVPESGPDQDEP